ncbi:transporter substrate-binding domain-containing protein [Vibrio kyushuensis]|uniref:substrate-binding periplasmic protein n=1 Tax=Vibrio kyushuensis TaxID=2910249 RepID=UPI003D11A1A6
MKNIAFSLLLLACSLSVSAKSIVLSTHNLSPYGSYEAGADIKKVANSDFTGIAVDRIRCAFKSMEIELTILVVPWARAQLLAQSGEVDGFFAGSQNEFRDGYAVKTDIIAEQKWNWYWLKSNPQDIDSLEPMPRIGAFLGSNMSKWLAKNNYPIHSQPETTEQLLLQLKNGRIDLFIANNLVTDKLVKNSGMVDQLESRLVKDKPLYLYLTRKSLSTHPMLIDNFNNALKQCYSKM